MAGKTNLFNKFGEFDSYKELNMAAEGLLKEGDIESLKILGEENGIDKYDVEDYIDGIVTEFSTPMTAAVGRVDIQLKGNKDGAIEVIGSFAKGMLTDESIQTAVMKKGKRLSKILDEMRNAAQKHKTGNSGVCCGTDQQLRNIIRSYLLDSDKEFKKKISDLYK